MNTHAEDGDVTFAMLGIDASLMLNELRDQIEFSEQNLQWQRRRELHRSDQEGGSEFERDEVHRRFDDLVQRTRYGSLISLLTIIERVATTIKRIAESMDRTLPQKPSGKSATVHTLEVLSGIGLGAPKYISKIETLGWVRNCIVHSAGFLDEYEHAAQLRDSLAAFEGIRTRYHEFWGQETIEIDDTCLSGQIDEAKEWVMSFCEK